MKSNWSVIVVGGLAVFTLSGCIPDSGTSTEVELALSELASGFASGITSERLEVISDDASFAGLWMQHAEGYSPPPIQPSVDFGQDIVIAAFLGTTATGGYNIEVTSVVEQSDRLIADIVMTVPGDNCLVTEAQSQPHQLVTATMKGKIVAFRTTVKILDC